MSFSGETWTSGQGSYISTWGHLMAGASRIAKKHLTLMWKLPPSNSHLACPSFYRGVIKYGEIHGLSLRRPSRALPATGLHPILLSLVRFSVLGNFLHLVITCLRRNKRSKKMLFLSSLLMLVSERYTVLSGSLIDATTRGKIIVHRRLTAAGRSARRIARIYFRTRPNHLFASTVVLCYVLAISTPRIHRSTLLIFTPWKFICSKKVFKYFFRIIVEKVLKKKNVDC